jgi:hypothetical protein
VAMIGLRSASVMLVKHAAKRLLSGRVRGAYPPFILPMEVLKEAPLMSPLEEKSRAALSPSTFDKLLVMCVFETIAEW